MCIIYTKPLLFRKRATAAECQRHEWLTKSLSTRSEKAKNAERKNLDITKDNLMTFVERWRQHPNSPYAIIADHDEQRREKNHDVKSLSSTHVQCPSSTLDVSPVSSVESSVAESVLSERDLPPSASLAKFAASLDFSLGRRSSESVGPAKHRNAANRIFLAEEILKLSEHLRSLSARPFTATSEQQQQTSYNRHPIKDVISSAGPKCATVGDTSSTRGNQSYLNEPTSAKNRLLHLLDKWEDVQRPHDLKRASISNDWCAEKLVPRNSLNSLAAYFRSCHATTAPTFYNPSRSVQR